MLKTYAFIIVLLLCSCTDSQNKSGNQSIISPSVNEDNNLKFELFDDRNNQEKALDALNSIQISGSNLYSTFAY